MADAASTIPRLLHMLTLIRSSTRWNAPALGEELGVSERTVYRDITRLQRAGIPVRLDERTGGYRVDGDCFVPPVDLTTEEAAALMVASQRAGGGAHLEPLSRSAASALIKLRAALPDAFRDELDEVLPRIRIDPAAGEEGTADDVWATVSRAIAEGRALRCTYEPARSSDERVHTTPFRFDPYALYFGQRAWYAVGLHHGRGETRSLKLARFTQADLTDQAFEVPDGFSLDRYFRQAWRMIPGQTRQAVRLWFSPEVADTVADTRWHSTQETEFHDDGSLTAWFEVDGLDEITWWILGYGPHCVVEAPEALRSRVSELARAAADRYPDQDPGQYEPD